MGEHLRVELRAKELGGAKQFTWGGGAGDIWGVSLGRGETSTMSKPPLKTHRRVGQRWNGPPSPRDLLPLSQADGFRRLLRRSLGCPPGRLAI
jgi:hypothetical protein